MTDAELEARLTRIGETTAPMRSKLRSALAEALVPSPWSFWHESKVIAGGVLVVLLVVGGGAWMQSTPQPTSVVVEDYTQEFVIAVAEDLSIESSALALYDAEIDAVIAPESDIFSDEFLDTTFQ
jgi:hypothetical protein